MTDKFNVKFAKTSIKLLLEKELSKKKNLKPNAVRSWMLMHYEKKGAFSAIYLPNFGNDIVLKFFFYFR